MLAGPPFAHFIDTGTRFLRRPYHHKHSLQRLVAALADVAAQQLVNGNQQRAGIGKLKGIGKFLHHDTALALVIGVD